MSQPDTKKERRAAAAPVKRCAACGRDVTHVIVYVSDRGQICAGCYYRQTGNWPRGHRQRTLLPRLVLLAGLLAGLAPFFRVVRESLRLGLAASRGWPLGDAALLGGALAGLAGLAALAIALRTRTDRGQGTTVLGGLGLIALGVYHLWPLVLRARALYGI